MFDDFSDNLGPSPRGPVNDAHLKEMFAQSLYWPPETIQAYQRTQLAQLLRHAKEHVPFYRNRLDCVFRNDGTIAWENWERIPILTKAEVRDSSGDMNAKWVPPQHGKIGWSKTSGSSGIPITFPSVALAGHVAKHSWARFVELHGVREPFAIAEFKVNDAYGQTLSEEYYHISYTSGLERYRVNRKIPIGRKLELLEQFGMTIVHDQSNHLEILARENLLRAKPVRFPWILALGMPVSQVQEDLFAVSFGASTLTAYSSEESTLIAFQCNVNRLNLHISSELVLLEVVDDQGQVVPHGKVGRCVVTHFFKFSSSIHSL